MLYKKSIVLIMFFLFSFSCKLSNNKEIEPNNTFLNANSIELNKEITATIDSENDTDNFILNIDEEQVLRVNLTGVKGVNHAIYIYRNETQKPQLIKIIDDNRKSSPETFSNLFVKPGQYYFTITNGSRDIKKGNKETPYKLLLTSRSYIDEEKEPNDIPFNATLIANQTVIKGYFSPAQNPMNNNSINTMQEFDWYKFDVNLSDGKPLLIDIKLSKVDGIDSIFKVFNSSLDELIAVDNAGSGEGEKLSDFGIKESGLYYIQVSSKFFLSNHDSNYELQLNYKDYDPNSEIEPNNNFESSNSFKQNFIRGKITEPTDQDVFYFSPANKNAFYSFNCIGDAGLDVIITIFDNNKNKLFSVNNTTANSNEIIPPLNIKNAVYISITAAGIINEDSHYTLEVNEADSNIHYESEPNNSKNEYNYLDKNITGFINNKKDKDFFLIKTDNNKKINFLIKGTKGGKIRISTTDPLGFIIKSKDIESDNEIKITEIFDKKGYLIIEPVIPVYEYPYNIKIEDIK